MDKVPGKFINMGNKKDEYKEFCRKFAAHMTCDWIALKELELSYHILGI